MTFRRLFDKPLAAAALLLVPGAAVLGLWAAGGTLPAERPVYDWSLRCLPAPPPGQVHLIRIDDETWRRLGGRNPDRAEIARLLDALSERKPALVVLDLLFVSPKDEALDAALEAAIAHVPTVLASSPAQKLEPLERFRARALGTGSIELMSDPDGIFRGLPRPYISQRDGALVVTRLPIALECARRIWFPSAPPEVELQPGAILLGSHRYAYPRGSWLIPFSGGDKTLPFTSFFDVLTDPASLPSLAGKVVLIGNTRVDEHDYFAVPLPAEAKPLGDSGHALDPARASSGEPVAPLPAFKPITTHSMAGLEVHGQALAALLDGRSLVPLSKRSEGMLLAGLCLTAAVLALVPMKPLPALSLWMGGAALGITGSLLALRTGTVLPSFTLGATWAAYAASSFGYHRWRDFAARRAVERLFGRYVSPNIALRLLKDPSLVHPGGRKKTLTILFSDVRGFTSLSERLAPEQVTEVLNLYFTEMMKILFAHDGTYDKFIGDALLAFFGDPVDQPDQTERALACAVAMQESAAALRARFEAEGLPPLRIGIAINTGPVVVGNHGSAESWSYTVIGDTVNLASRLQGLAQQNEVILSAETAARIPGLRDRYEVEDLEPVKVKGKSEPIPILRVVGRKREVVP